MDTPSTELTLGRDRSLGDILRDARQAKGLELSDIAEITHVRKEYLKALEANDYSALPEDIYTKNFVKLFAQSVGLQEARVMELYARSRGRTLAQTTKIESVSEVQGNATRAEPARLARPPLRIGAWLPTLIFIAIIVSLALWGFGNFSRPTRLAPVETALEGSAEPREAASVVAVEPTSAVTAEVPTDDAGSEALAEGAATADPTTASEDGLFALTVTSEPPGADVSIDGFALPGTTPLTYRLSPGTSRTLRLSLEGYETFEDSVDLSSDSEQTITLTPLAQTPAVTTTEDVSETAEVETPDIPAAPPSEGLGITITETTWLEAYQSSQRGVGERLVYTTVQPGQTFTFTLPVFLHVGNAGGVDLTLDGQALGAMGSSGEVISQAYAQ